MHQVQVTAPQGTGEKLAKLALAGGISSAAASHVYVHGPGKDKEQVTINASTPQAEKFVHALLTADFFNPGDYTVITQQPLAIVSQESPAEITQPMKITPLDIYEDLWQESHITIGFVARAAIAALLLSYGMIANDRIVMVAALLFTPFLVQDMAIGFGLWSRDFRLAAQGIKAVGLNTLLTILSGFLVASVMEPPLKYDQFASIEVNFVISLLVGLVAGLSSSDAVGRRELIGMAAAAQFAIYPAWFGISLVYGFPPESTTWWRVLSFLVNVSTILIVSFAVYGLLRYQPTAIQRYSEQTESLP